MIRKRISFLYALFFLIFFSYTHIMAQDAIDTDNTIPYMVEEFDARTAVSKTTRIVGGIEAEEGEWPWMVALISMGQRAYEGQFCGGSLIGSQWVITAAHCTEGQNPEDIEVLIGAHHLSDDEGQRFRVDRIIQHPNYDPFIMDSDIALIHLTTPTSQETIDLVESRDPDGLTIPFTAATVIGWGATDPYSTNYPTELRQVTVPILPSIFALRAYGSQKFTINMIAAGLPIGGKDTCSGDSGGPLIVPDNSGSGWVLGGITSWGLGCAQPRHPGVYTRLSRFTNWVELIMEDGD